MNGRTRINANIMSRDELKKIIHLVEQVNGKVFLTINAPFYTENMYTYIMEYLEELANIGVRNLIVSDIGLMELISRYIPEFKITVSCVAQTLSFFQVDFFKQFAVERIVFPRFISVFDICEIAKNHPEIEFECFALSEKCIHGDGFCRSMHGIGTYCKDSWKGTYNSLDGTKIHSNIRTKLEYNHNIYRSWISPDRVEAKTTDNLACSLCAIGDFLHYPNIKAIKISGRGRCSGFVKMQIKISKRVICMFENGSNISEVKKYVSDTLGLQYCIGENYCNMRGI